MQHWLNGDGASSTELSPVALPYRQEGDGSEIFPSFFEDHGRADVG